MTANMLIGALMVFAITALALLLATRNEIRRAADAIERLEDERE